MATRRSEGGVLFRLKVTGPGIKGGRVPVPDLVRICSEVQAAVNRQAEALEGKETLRPGPFTARARFECTLELLGIREGSAVLPFGLLKPQMPLDFSRVTTLGAEAVAEVAEAVEALEAGRTRPIDRGVLDSFQNLGEVFDQKRVSTIQFVVSKRVAKKRRVEATFNATVRKRVLARLKHPTRATRVVEGILEMADFKPSDHRCRLTPPLGPPVGCTFDEDRENQVQEFLRKPVRAQGEATLDPYSGRIESLHINTIEPIQSFSVGAEEFHAARSIQELAAMQGVEPLKNAGVLAGVLSESDDLDGILDEIYRERE